MNPEQIYAIERPHRSLLTLYIWRSVLSGPLVFLVLPFLYFRYVTMRYRFDDEGVSMRWGILFRREVNLTYARIQDIHLSSGLLQRWLGLADLQIQTASGSAAAEMTIEGLREYSAVRDYLYSRMRGHREAASPPANEAAGSTATDAEVVAILSDAVRELQQSREALERVAAGASAARSEGQSRV